MQLECDPKPIKVIRNQSTDLNGLWIKPILHIRRQFYPREIAFQSVNNIAVNSFAARNSSSVTFSVAGILFSSTFVLQQIVVIILNPKCFLKKHHHQGRSDQQLYNVVGMAIADIAQ